MKESMFNKDSPKKLAHAVAMLHSINKNIQVNNQLILFVC